MSLRHPSAKITLGGQTLTAAEAGLVHLAVRLGRGTHDPAELTFWPSSQFASAAPGDPLSIALGDAGSEQDVWSGKVGALEYAPDALTLVGQASTLALSRERRAKTYVKQKLGDVVRDLAGSVTVDTVDGDPDIAYYAVDQRRTVWGHLLDLAKLSGCEITSSPSGGLRFVAINPQPSSVRYRYGADILRWQIEQADAGSSATFAAHGSASESGSDKWHWLNPDPTSGAGGAQVIGGFHSRSLADALSRAAEGSAKRGSVGGVVELLGQADLRAGDVFSLADLTGGDPGALRALTVTHSLDAATGFRTFVSVEGAGV